MPEPTTPTPDTMRCPGCRQDVTVRTSSTGVLRLSRHQISGSTPTQGFSCPGVGWEVVDQ